MSDILIEIEKKDEAHFAPFLAAMASQVTEVEATRFDGMSIVQLLVAINGVTVPVVGKLIAESIRSKRHVVVKRKGVEIKGLDAEGVIAVLREIERHEAPRDRKPSLKRGRARS